MAKNALGKHYGRGISVRQLMKMFPDDETSEAWFVENRWPDGIRCAYCESDNVQVGAKHPSMSYRCRQCRKFFSVKTNTVMQSSKLRYQAWAWALYFVTTGLKGVSSMKLHRDLVLQRRVILQGNSWADFEAGNERVRVSHDERSVAEEEDLNVFSHNASL